VDGAVVALGCAASRSRRNLDTLDHEPNHGTTKLHNLSFPLLDRPLTAQGFSERLSVSVDDAAAL